MVSAIKAFVVKILLAFVWVYKYGISPYLPSACRYHPTCSDYMAQAIKKYGPIKGLWYGLKRLGRCHPWGGSGFDPIP